jgi:hypothetical protein
MTAEFKFPCPTCGQPVQADTHDCGSKVKCPACQADIVVPQPDAAPKPGYFKGQHTVPVPKHAHGAPRASGVVAPPPAPPAPSMHPLAVVSFWLSLSSVLIWPFGFIPGIICARKAKAEIRKNPALHGRKLAQLALVMGYGFAVLFGVAAVFAVLHFKASQKSPKPREKTAQQSEPVRTMETNLPPVVEASPTNVWTLYHTNMTIPAWPAAGKIHGRDFKHNQAGVGTNILTMHQGTNFPHDLSVWITFRQKPGESLSGKKFAFSADTESPLKEVRIGWKEGQDEKVWQTFTNGYALKLEFGNVTRDSVTGTNMMAGTIYLCLPDTNYSYIAGTFDARIGRRPPPVVKSNAKQGAQPGAPSGPKKGRKGKKR